MAVTNVARDLDPYLAGERIYGDDMSAEEVERWWADERRAYADLGASHAESYRYKYHALNRFHGFARPPSTRQLRVLGFGSAYGHELLPIITERDSVVIIEPAEALHGEAVLPVEPEYICGKSNGRIPCPDETFDVITCFGVLHHIPNVSQVVEELVRVLAVDGVMFIREPIISLGDWRYPRAGLTKRERGIPLHCLLSILEANGTRVVSSSFCMFPIVPRLGSLFGVDAYNSQWLTRFDSLLSRLWGPNLRYHATAPWHKLRPTSAFLVVARNDNGS